jgi:hypothetical protein
MQARAPVGVAPAARPGCAGRLVSCAARCPVAIDATRTALAEHEAVQEARFWLFDRAAYDAFSEALCR